METPEFIKNSSAICSSITLRIAVFAVNNLEEQAVLFIIDQQNLNRVMRKPVDTAAYLYYLKNWACAIGRKTRGDTPRIIHVRSRPIFEHNTTSFSHFSRPWTKHGILEKHPIETRIMSDPLVMKLWVDHEKLDLL